jgi:cytochrome c-type biogenesis protein CcmH
MTLFWILAVVLIAGALLCVLPPLFRQSRNTAVAADPNTALNIAVYHDQQRELEADRRAGTLTDEQYERARLELERRLLDDVGDAPAPVDHSPRISRAPAVVMALTVPLLAVGLYFAVGNPQALAPVALPKHAADSVTPQQIEAMVAKLAERMKQNPDDAQGWAMLGKSYAVMGRFEDAAAAYARAVERVPDNPQLLTDYADALAMARGQNLQGEPEALILRALKLDPDHPKALALAGTVAFDRKDYAGAIRYWEKLSTLVPPDSEMGRSVQSSITEARTLAGGAGVAKVADKPTTEKVTPAAPGAAGVSGTVTLAPAMAGKAAPDDAVFIFARAVEGSRMPLAILRKKVSDLPLTFALDDSMAMTPQTPLSSAPQVIIGARISKSGEAMPRSGDLQGFSKAVNNSAKNIAVVIDNEVR